MFLWFGLSCLITGITHSGYGTATHICKVMAGSYWSESVQLVMGVGWRKSLVWGSWGSIFLFSSLELWYTGLSNPVVWYGGHHLLPIMVEILKFANKLDPGQGHLYNNASLTCRLSWEVCPTQLPKRDTPLAILRTKPCFQSSANCASNSPTPWKVC